MASAGVASLPRAAPAPSSLYVWGGLGIVYVVWGSTYLAIRVMVETIPPLLGAGVRFLAAGVLMLAFLTAVKGWRAVRPTGRQLAGAGLIGLLLPGANAVVTIAEVDVPSALAALLIASVPLILIVLRSATGDRPARASYLGVVVGFAGVGLLLLPGERPDGATLGGMLLCVGAAAMWATGSFTSSRIALPRNPLVSVAWQMLLGGAVITLAGVAAGETADVSSFSTDSWLALGLPRLHRLDDRLHRLRLAAAERAGLEGRHLRVREPGRRDPARLADPRRDDHRADADRGDDHHRLRRPHRAGRDRYSAKGRSNSVDSTTCVCVRVTPGASRRRSSVRSRCSVSRARTCRTALASPATV